MSGNQLYGNSVWAMDSDSPCWWNHRFCLSSWACLHLQTLDLGWTLVKSEVIQGLPSPPPDPIPLVTIYWVPRYISAPGRNKTHEESAVMKTNFTISQNHWSVRKWSGEEAWAKVLWRREFVDWSDKAEHGKLTCLLSCHLFILSAQINQWTVMCGFTRA